MGVGAHVEMMEGRVDARGCREQRGQGNVWAVEVLSRKQALCLSLAVAALWMQLCGVERAEN